MISLDANSVLCKLLSYDQSTKKGFVSFRMDIKGFSGFDQAFFLQRDRMTELNVAIWKFPFYPKSQVFIIIDNWSLGSVFFDL